MNHPGITSLVILCLVLISPGALATSTAEKSVTGTQQELVFLTWSEYMDPEIIQTFEQRFNIKVKMVYFESDDTRDDILLETEGKGFDLVLVNGASLYSYERRGWLAKLANADIPNKRHIQKKWFNAYPGAANYAIPLFWGTLGIGYRKDLVNEKLTSWKQLYQPNPELHNKIVMIKTSRDVIGMGLKSLGYSANSTDPKQLDETEKLLLQQKPYVRRYSYVALNEDSGLNTGEIIAAMMYSGDALMLQEVQENIEYSLPEEGGGIWVDYLTVMGNSSKKPLAYQFINFLNEPKIAAQLAKYVYYAPTNTAAEKLLPEDFKNNPIIYPSAEALKNSETSLRLPPRTIKKHNNIFLKLLQ